MTTNTRKNVTALLAGAIVMVVLLFGVWWGGHPSYVPDFLRGRSARRSTPALDESVQRIIDDYYAPEKRADLVNGSIAGVVASLHDRFSNYLTPKQYDDFETSAASGSPASAPTVVRTSRGLHIVQVFPNSPAARGGLVAGDTITAVDGQSLTGRSEAAATALIKGRVGHEVTLAVLHGGHSRVVTLTRAEVSLPIVDSALRTVGGKKVGVVALRTFSSGAHGEVAAAVEKRCDAGRAAIVLDLRGNGGGLVDEARLVASIFFADGPIVTTRGRTQPTRRR